MKRFTLLLLFLCLLCFTTSAFAVVKDSYTTGGMGGAADNFSGGRHAWDAGRIQVTSSYTLNKVTVRLRRVECEESSSCTVGGNRTHPYFTASIYTHNSSSNSPGSIVGNASTNQLNFNSLTNWTTNKSSSSVAFVDFTFEGLNAPVSSGLYWIVIHNVDWANVYPNHLDHYLQFVATNTTPVGGGSIGRAISYTLGNGPSGISWTEWYNGQFNFIADDGGGSATVPTAPTGVTATSGDGQVTINWTASTGATSYNIYWSTSSGVTTTTGTKITGVTSPYTHTGRANGLTYYYIVTAVNSAGESSGSNQASATPNGSSGHIYYIATSGCSDNNAGTSVGSPWCTFSKANSTLVAGDTVYVRGGTYSTSNIDPNNSGTSTAWITYRNYPDETPLISGRSNVAYLNGNHYIQVVGINGNNSCHPIEIRNSSAIIIEGGVYGPHNYQPNCSNNWAANRITDSSSYIFFKNNTFYQYGATGDNGVILEIGQENPPSGANHILIEGNTFYWSGHHVVGMQADHIIFRNNWVHNEAWINGTYGGRNIYSQGTGAYSNVIEGNTFAWDYLAGDGNTPSGLGTIAGRNTIIRYNKSYNNCAGGMSFTCSGGYQSCPRDNYIYNNSLYNNDRCPSGNSGQCAIIFQDGGPGSITGLHIKNNIYEDHVGGDYCWGGGVYSQDQEFANNFGNNSGDPLFVNEGGSNPFDISLPDLRLQSGSPCIDAGGALTTTTNSGTNSTTMTVADSGYFMDGFGLVTGDTIQIVGTTQRSTITSISGNTIYLATALTWSSGQGVAYMYTGNAPDQGAGEWATSGGGTPVPQPPSAPTGLQATSGDKQVTISWSPVSNATAYNIYWSTTSGVTKQSGTKIANVTSPYVHGGLIDGCTYFYIVTAVNSAGESVDSSQVSSTVTTSIRVSWTASSTYTDGGHMVPVSYKLYWGTVSGTYTNSLNVGDVTTYTIPNLQTSTNYYFAVTVTDTQSVESAKSLETVCSSSNPSCQIPEPGGDFAHGFNFRETANFVVDGSDESYVLDENWPTTRNSTTFGWETIVDIYKVADRVSTNDRRLAGVFTQINTGEQAVFRVELPHAGTYEIWLAQGDASYSSSYRRLDIYDNNTLLYTLEDIDGTSVQRFNDAQGTEWTNSTWATNNKSIILDFTSTTFRLKLGSIIPKSNDSTLAHLYIAEHEPLVTPGSASSRRRIGSF